jgi:hypothetical protein
METQRTQSSYAVSPANNGEEKKQYAQIKLNPYWFRFKESPTDVILFAELKNTPLIEKYNKN